jgi:uncharacterized protein YggE
MIESSYGVIMKLSSSFLFGGLVLAAITAPAQQIQVNKDNRSIAVTATDHATAAAETATVHIGFQLFAATSDAAYAQGSRTSNAIMAALKKTGIDDKAIQSENQGIATVQPYETQNLPEAQKAQRQFQITQSWTVKISAKDAASVLDTAVQAGANNSGSIDWDVSDRKALQAEAAGLALQRAQAIAEQMAKGLGVKLNGLIYASNQAPESAPRPLAFARAKEDNAASSRVAPLAISAQRIEETATVYAVFAIE